MKKVLTLLSLCIVLTSSQLLAGGASFDARTFMTPRAVSAKVDRLNATAFNLPFLLHHDAAEQVFAGTQRELTLTNMPLPTYGEATLELVRTPSVFDANSKFLVNTRNGKQPFRVRPIQSFRGTVNGDVSTLVTLHYSEGDLTGFVEHADGKRTVIGQDWSSRAVSGATPHVVADEASAMDPMNLSNFTCGADLLPADERAAVTSMMMPSSLKKGETPQQMPLKELKLAVVLREDIDSILSRRGMNEEQIAQYFAKIVAAMSQAYEEDLNTRMYIAYLLLHTEDAPSGYFNDGTEPGELLSEFSLDWSSGYADVDRTVAHLYTIKKPKNGQYVGGIAYGGQAGTRLCVKAHRGGYGVSTIDLFPNQEIPGDPTRANAFVWDVFVAAHEIGHNVGAPHTHNCFWSPPVDTCQLKYDSTDACYDKPMQRVVRPGTIMSYCHLVNGSTTPLTFGSIVAERMRTWVDASCMTMPPDPLVSITSPRGSENWSGGKQVTVRWVSHRVDNVNLDYSVNGGTSWTSIVTNVPAVDSQYVWTIPSIGAQELWIRLSDASNVNVQAISISSHSITVPLELLNPAGGERLGVGTSFNIRFNKQSNVGAVNILFSADDGQVWEEVATNVAASPYLWTVPNVATTTARIRVVAATNASFVDTSEPFTIGTPRFELLLPAEGSNICNNQDNQYNWSADFVDRIRIEYSADEGATWKLAVQQISIPAEQWQVFSRNSNMSSLALGAKIKLRVLDAANRDIVYDTRDVLNVIACDAPVSVAEATASSTGLTIVNVTPNPASTTVNLEVKHQVGARLQIFAVDQAGASVMLKDDVEVIGDGTTTIGLPVDAFASGAYRLVVRSGNMMADAPLKIVR